MGHRIENEWVSVVVDIKGAELKSLYSKKAEKEYLWQGDPQYWGRSAPVLFPIVGKLQEDTYELDGKTYGMSQHGFARDKDFRLVEHTEGKAIFELDADSQTKEQYPYEFKLTLTYELQEKTLTVTYELDNLNDKRMYFSIGGHPGFQVPMTPDTTFEDYVVSVRPEGARDRIPLEGAFADMTQASADESLGEGLPLRYPLFDRDALIYRMEGRNELTLHSGLHNHFVRVSFEDFPYLGIWTPPTKEAPFLCIEPWHGLADTVDASGDLKEKTGIQSLDPNERFQTSYSIEID